MATRLRDERARVLGELRYEPTEKRVRAVLGDYSIADSTRTVLVWEPRRVLPNYAFPAEDVVAPLRPADPAEPDPARPADAPILHGGFPFEVHTAAGEDVAVGDRERAGFLLRDPDLSGYVVLDFHAFDAWYEEDEPIVGHPREPFHRVDIRRSSRHVRIELDGELLAESNRPHLVFETSLPIRFYIPREDVRVPMRATDKRTICAYKGRASYWELETAGGPRSDLAWTYPAPLPDATVLTGLVAFFDEKVGVTLDGELREPETRAIAKTIVEEADVSSPAASGP
jgi:uncharacterized protein (DUF427 family)